MGPRNARCTRSGILVDRIAGGPGHGPVGSWTAAGPGDEPRPVSGVLGQQVGRT
jgi:hypothetical protein